MTAYLGALVNDTRKSLLIQWSYRFNFVVWIASAVVIYSGAAWLFGDNEITRFETRASWLVGFLMWMYAVAVIDEMTWGLREETLNGTLEQMAMGIAPTPVLLLGRVLARFIVTTGQVISIGITAALIFNLSLPLRWEIVPVLAILVFGTAGFGFIMGGLVLLFKQIESFANALINLTLFVNGSIISVDKFGSGAELVMRLMPTTEGILALREIIFDDMSLADSLVHGHLDTLCLHSAAAFMLGAAVYTLCQRIAARRGTLGQY